MKVSIELGEKELAMIKGYIISGIPEEFETTNRLIEGNKNADVAIVDNIILRDKNNIPVILGIGCLAVAQLLLNNSTHANKQ